MNSLAVLAAAAAAGAEPGRAAEALAELEALPGRGRRCELSWRGGTLTLIDESYNASPAAVDAALAVLGATPPADGGRRVAVLGDMLELGAASERLHRELAAAARRSKGRPRLSRRGSGSGALRRPAQSEAGRLVAHRRCERCLDS